jgi:hypothetical protein
MRKESESAIGLFMQEETLRKVPNTEIDLLILFFVYVKRFHHVSHFERIGGEDCPKSFYLCQVSFGHNLFFEHHLVFFFSEYLLKERI